MVLWEDLLSEVVGFGEIFKNRIHLVSLGGYVICPQASSVGMDQIHCHVVFFFFFPATIL